MKQANGAPWSADRDFFSKSQRTGRGLPGRSLLRASALFLAFGLALGAQTLSASAQNSDSSAGVVIEEPRIECLYELLPTRAKLRFELAARLGGDAARGVVMSARAPAFLDLMDRCGFDVKEATVARATAYWAARGARMIAAIEADRAGLNVETLSMALLSVAPRETLADLAEEIISSEQAAAAGRPGEIVLATLEAYQGLEGTYSEETAARAAVFITAEIIVIGMETGAAPQAQSGESESNEAGFGTITQEEVENAGGDQ